MTEPVCRPPLPCQECGVPVIEFTVPNEVWNQVTGTVGEGYLCIWCWDKLAAARGVAMAYEAEFHWTGLTGRSKLFVEAEQVIGRLTMLTRQQSSQYDIWQQAWQDRVAAWQAERARLVAALETIEQATRHVNSRRGQRSRLIHETAARALGMSDEANTDTARTA